MVSGSKGWWAPRSGSCPPTARTEGGATVSEAGGALSLACVACGWDTSPGAGFQQAFPAGTFSLPGSVLPGGLVFKRSNSLFQA